MSLSSSLRVEKQTERLLNKTNALRRQKWTPFLADFLEGGHSAGALKDRRQKTENRRLEKTEEPRTQLLHLQLRCSPP
jgi:hypothetical protein